MRHRKSSALKRQYFHNREVIDLRKHEKKLTSA